MRLLGSHGLNLVSLLSGYHTQELQSSGRQHSRLSHPGLSNGQAPEVAQRELSECGVQSFALPNQIRG